MSQAPPAFAINNAISTPVTVAPASNPPSDSGPKTRPTITGDATATTPGAIISLRAALVEMSTHLALSGLTPGLPSNKPSISRNWRRISVTISPAALPTLVIVMAATINGSAPPINSPITTMGFVNSIVNPGVAISTADLNAAKSAKAVNAALPIAKPLPTAAVVFPMESNASVISRTSEPNSPISAIPPALSATGPYASTVIVTPTVASIPIAAIAIPYNPAKSLAI